MAPISSSDETLAVFVASLSQDHSASTVHTCIAVVQWLHIRLAISHDRCTSVLSAVMTHGIKRSQAALGRLPRLSMTIDIITHVCCVLSARFQMDTSCARGAHKLASTGDCIFDQNDTSPGTFCALQ